MKIFKSKNKVNQLAQFLLQDGRMEDFMRSIRDAAYQQQLFVEYGLEEA